MKPIVLLNAIRVMRSRHSVHYSDIDVIIDPYVIYFELNRGDSVIYYKLFQSGVLHCVSLEDMDDVDLNKL